MFPSTCTRYLWKFNMVCQQAFDTNFGATVVSKGSLQASQFSCLLLYPSPWLSATPILLCPSWSAIISALLVHNLLLRVSAWVIVTCLWKFAIVILYCKLGEPLVKDSFPSCILKWICIYILFSSIIFHLQILYLTFFWNSKKHSPSKNIRTCLELWGSCLNCASDWLLV